MPILLKKKGQSRFCECWWRSCRKFHLFYTNKQIIQIKAKISGGGGNKYRNSKEIWWLLLKNVAHLYFLREAYNHTRHFIQSTYLHVVTPWLHSPRSSCGCALSFLIWKTITTVSWSSSPAHNSKSQDQSLRQPCRQLRLTYCGNRPPTSPASYSFITVGCFYGKWTAGIFQLIFANFQTRKNLCSLWWEQRKQRLCSELDLPWGDPKPRRKLCSPRTILISEQI